MPNFPWADQEYIKRLLGMATGDAAMGAEELERLSVWFRDKWKHGPCPVCTETAWMPNPKVLQIFNEQTMVDGSAYPVVVIICINCGYTIPVNARIAGVRVDDPPAEEPPRAGDT